MNYATRNCHDCKHAALVTIYGKHATCASDCELHAAIDKRMAMRKYINEIRAQPQMTLNELVTVLGWVIDSLIDLGYPSSDIIRLFSTSEYDCLEIDLTPQCVVKLSPTIAPLSHTRCPDTFDVVIDFDLLMHKCATVGAKCITTYAYNVLGLVEYMALNGQYA